MPKRAFSLTWYIPLYFLLLQEYCHHWVSNHDSWFHLKFLYQRRNTFPNHTPQYCFLCPNESNTVILIQSFKALFKTKGLCSSVINVLVTKSCPTFLWHHGTTACQSPLSMGFSRQEFWSGVPIHSPGDVPNSGVKSLSSCIGRWILYHWATWEAICSSITIVKL